MTTGTNEPEIVTAAAEGAAAAVAAVQDDQAERERLAAMENTTVDATIAAEGASQSAEQASAAAAEAAAIASEAASQAGAAAEAASTATEEAFDARQEIESVRQEFGQAIGDFRSWLESRLPAKPDSTEPTEVVVGHDAGTNTTPDESRADAGSSGSATSAGNTSRGRHKFGRR